MGAINKMPNIEMTSSVRDVVQESPLHSLATGSSSAEYIRQFIKRKFANSTAANANCLCYGTCDTTFGDSCSACCGGGGGGHNGCVCHSTCDDTVGDSCGACCGSRATDKMPVLGMTSSVQDADQAKPSHGHATSSFSSEYIKNFIKSKFANSTAASANCLCYDTCDTTFGDSCSACCGGDCGEQNGC